MLINKLKKCIQDSNCNIAMLIKDLSNNEVKFSYNEEKKCVSASIIKVPILIEALSRADSCSIPLSKKISIYDHNKIDFSIITEQNLNECTFEELITWMIIASDNCATNVLIDILGLDEINNRIKSFKMKNTRLQRKMMDFNAIKDGKNNFTSLSDMLILMEGLYNGEIINNEVSKRAIAIMKNQRDNSMLKRYIAENVSLANKTGELDNLNNDVGIFYTKNRDYFIGIFVNDAKNNKEGSIIIGKLSKIVYEYFRNIQ